MNDKLKQLLSNVWVYVVAGFGLLFALFKYEQKGKVEAESKLAQANVDKEDAVLEQKGKDIEAQIDTEKKNLDEEQKRTLSQEELEESLRKL